jgi:hypothetical protein
MIFSTSGESYQISHIIFVGAVHEIPQDKKKSDNTHSFRLVTSQGSAFCYFKSIETARKARFVLESMIESVKSNLFKNCGETLDIAGVVSFGRIVQLKNVEHDMTHAFIVTINSVNEKYNQLWFRYKSEETARHARNALWAKIESINRIPLPETSEKAETVVAECSVELES